MHWNYSLGHVILRVVQLVELFAKQEYLLFTLPRNNMAGYDITGKFVGGVFDKFSKFLENRQFIPGHNTPE